MQILRRNVPTQRRPRLRENIRETARDNFDLPAAFVYANIVDVVSREALRAARVAWREAEQAYYGEAKEYFGDADTAPAASEPMRPKAMDIFRLLALRESADDARKRYQELVTETTN